jgi:prepilin peptidase CpaA
VRLVFDVTLVALALAGGWFDIRTRRIPNALTLTGLLVGLLLRAPFGLPAVADGVLGAGFGFLIAVPLFALGAFGGGDTKFLIALGAFLGGSRLLGALLVIALVGGVLAVLDAIRRGAMVRLLRDSAALTLNLVTFGRVGSRPTIESAGVATIPYGVPMAIGAVAWWFLGGKVL